MARAHIRSHVIRLLACLSLAFLAGSTVEAAATMNPLDAIDTVTPGPVLTGAVCTGEGQGVLVVTGEQFTPGGEVAVALSALGKTDLAVNRSIHASQSVFGPNSSTDPARGFQSGGSVGIALRSWCQEARMVRAFDLQRGIWSNELNVNLRREPAVGSHAVPPNRHSDPVAGLAQANLADPALLTASADLCSISVDPVSLPPRPAPPAMEAPQPLKYIPTGPGAPGRRQNTMAVSSHLIELERGTRSEFAHLATLALDHDLRVELAAMAAARHPPPVVE